jgi:hypothetical protein
MERGASERVAEGCVGRGRNLVERGSRKALRFDHGVNVQTPTTQ